MKQSSGVAPAVSAHIANRLQYDPKRVAYNKARIESVLPEWNKLFEKPGARLRTIYPTSISFRGTKYK